MARAIVAIEGRKPQGNGRWMTTLVSSFSHLCLPYYSSKLSFLDADKVQKGHVPV